MSGFDVLLGVGVKEVGRAEQVPVARILERIVGGKSERFFQGQAELLGKQANIDVCYASKLAKLGKAILSWRIMASLVIECSALTKIGPQDSFQLIERFLVPEGDAL